jgi:GT2 family glycosyltransferase
MVRRTHMTTLPGWRTSPAKSGALDDCCLVVATYDRHHEVVRLLDNIVSLPDQPAEIVIVDGHPSRELGRILREWSAHNPAVFDLVYVESPPGLTRQRNVGVDISTRPYVFFLDDDAVPLPGYFAEMRRVFESDRERCVGGIAGCVINEMDKPLCRRWKLRLALGLVPRMEPMIYHPSGTHVPRSILKPFSGVRRIDVLPGCAWTFRREVFDSERFSCFFQGYSQGEDLEMSLRVGRRWTLLCSGDARILHLPAAHGRPVSYTRGRMEMRNRYFVWKRHTPRPAPRHVAGFWIDTMFLIAMDLAWFARRPWKVQPLGHALGTLAEMLRCLSGPPRFVEPLARREYVLAEAAAALVVPDRELAARRAE